MIISMIISMILAILSALLQHDDFSLKEEASRLLSGAFKSTAAFQEAGRCLPVLAYIAGKRSEDSGHWHGIKHCLFVGQLCDQSTGHDVSCFQALLLKQCQVAVL